MKKVYIVRHAKSSWRDIELEDIDRPLKPKGVEAAYDLGFKLKQNNELPVAILSSPANRAIHTAIIVARVLQFSTHQIEINSQLYESSVDSQIECIKKTGNQLSSVMLVGHDPGLTSLVNHFTALDLEKINTAGAVCLQFECATWDEISPENCTHQFTLKP